MFCPKCGQENTDIAQECGRCGEPLQSSFQQRRVTLHHRPPNYLVHAILVTLFCCLPFGVVAIVHAAQVDSKHSSGDYHGAAAASEKALTWVKAAFYTGLVVAVINVAIAFSSAA